MDVSELAPKAAQAGEWLKTLANENRLMVLCALLESELGVGALNARVPLSQSALSQHLALLREAGLVAARREGQRVFYRLADADVVALIRLLHRRFCEGAS